MDIKFDVPTKKETPLEKIATFFKSLAILVIIAITVGFTIIGSYKLGKSLFTNYDLQAIDVIELVGGLSLLFLMTIVILTVEIKSKVQSIGEAVLVLLKPKPSPASPFDFLRGLAGQDGIKGSINVVDLTNGEMGESIFKGDFSNLDELKDLKNKIMTSMLNSQKEFKGKQVTKQEMLDTMTLEELEAERIKAEQEEEWIWAAAVRDKIKEKSQK